MVRDYRKSDFDDVVRIANVAYRDIYKGMRNTLGDEIFEVVVPDASTRKGLQVIKQIEHNPDWIMVCEEEGKVVGFLTYVLSGESAAFSNNAADPECTVKGIGQQMYRAAFERFRKLKVKVVSVRTGLDEAHAPARRAYERAGFSVQNEGVTYYMKL